MNSLLIAKNTIKRLLKEPYSFAVLLLIPLFAGLMGVYMFGDESLAKIGIANLPNESVQLVQTIEASNKFKLQYMNQNIIENSVKENKIKIGVVFPKTSGIKGQEQKIRIYSMNNDTNLLTLENIINGYLDGVNNRKLSASSSTIMDTLKDTPRMSVPVGFMLMCILMFAGTGIGIILEDKRNKTFMRIFCTPLRGYEAVLGSFIANILLGLFQISFTLTVSIYLMKIDFGVSFIELFTILSVFLLTSIGFNIGLAGFIRNNHVFIIVNVIYASCTGMISGCFIPLRMLSAPLRNIANFFPQKWAMEAYNKLATGGRFTDIGIDLAVLVLFGLVLFTFGAKVIKPSGEDL